MLQRTLTAAVSRRRRKATSECRLHIRGVVKHPPPSSPTLADRAGLAVTMATPRPRAVAAGNSKYKLRIKEIYRISMIRPTALQGSFSSLTTSSSVAPLVPYPFLTYLVSYSLIRLFPSGESRDFPGLCAQQTLRLWPALRLTAVRGKAS